MVCFALCVVRKVRFSVFCTASNGSSKRTKKLKPRQERLKKNNEELNQGQEHGLLGTPDKL